MTIPAYTPTDWQDSPSTVTPLDAANLDKLEQGVKAATDQANNAQIAAVGAQAYSDAKTLVGTTAIKTGNFTAESNKLHPVDTTSGAITATLPSATGNAGATLGILKIDESANLVTVTGTINGNAGATYHLNVGEGVELLSDGAGSWWLQSSQGADLSGLAAQSALDAANANIATNTTAIANLSDQQTQLSSVAATIDELTVSTVMHGVWISHTWTEILSSGAQRVLWVAPFDCQVVACELMSDFGAIAASPTNLMTFSLRQIPGGGNFVTKTTNDEALTARVGWNLDNATWDPVVSRIAKGNSLSVNFSFSGTATLQFPVAITCRVVPI